MKHTIVSIKWKDSFTSPGWNWPEEDDRMWIQSIGILVRENKESITLASSRSEAGKYMDQLTIPHSAIFKIRKWK